MAFAGKWISVRAYTATGITIFERNAHISGNKRISLIPGGALLAPASDVARRTVASRLPIRSKMTRASKSDEII